MGIARTTSLGQRTPPPPPPHFEQLFYLYAGITLVLGLYLTYAGFKASPPSR